MSVWAGIMWWGASVLVIGGCVEAVSDRGPDAGSGPVPSGAAAGAATSSAPTPLASSSASASAVAAAPPSVSTTRALEVLFRGSVPSGSACKPGDDGAFVRCLVGERFVGHAEEATLALALFDELGDVVGTEREQDMEGGFRGTIHLVPELPVGTHKRHLAWVLSAQRSIAAFEDGLRKSSDKPVRYRHRALAWRFLRSVGRTTPSAYAASWEVGYNVSGSLHSGEQAVRETIFHEVFHLNDEEHGDWSARALAPIVSSIVKRCGTKTPCLKPFAPGKTMVRGGTYYAFQPDNGEMAHEYAAELATRYFLEQSARMSGERYPDGWFKCGAKENAEAYRALADEFFGGVDRTPACE